MGILGLRNLLKENARRAMERKTLDAYSGQTIAIDGEIVLHEFLVAMPTVHDSKGVKTGHLLGFLRRTAKLVDLGIEPVYVFDGPAPPEKKPELERRRMRRLGNVTGAGNTQGKIFQGTEYADVDWRTEVSEKQHNDCKRLLFHLRVPYVQAPSEGEMQCCYLCKTNKVDGVASEDSDCITHGAQKVLMNFKCRDGIYVTEYNHAKILNELGLSNEQLIDLCILSGCDYCDRIDGMNAQKALNLIREHKTIEIVLQNIDRTKYLVPVNWHTQYKKARRLFNNPKVIGVTSEKLKRTEPPDEEGLRLFLGTEHDFGEDTIDEACIYPLFSNFFLSNMQESPYPLR